MWNVLLWNALYLILLQLIWAGRFYLAGDMKNLYFFIQGSLEWTFREYFSLMYRYGINTNTLHLTFFSCRISFLLYKMLIITGISMETRNELTIYATLCRNVSMFYWQELASLFQVQEKFKTCRNSKWKFLSCCLQMTVMSKLSG